MGSDIPGTLDIATLGFPRFMESARQLVRWIEEFGSAPKPPRGDHHDPKPTITMPWNQSEPPTRSGDVHG